MIAGILAILAVLGSVIQFIKWLLVKYVVHAVIISFQFGITAAVITFTLAFYAFTITALIVLYNQMHGIFDYIENSNVQLVSCFYNMLNCAGASTAIDNGILMIWSAFTTVAVFNLFRFTLFGMRLIGNEVFKLGMLIGQAVK